jgi:hypothetical protein
LNSLSVPAQITTGDPKKEFLKNNSPPVRENGNDFEAYERDAGKSNTILRSKSAVLDIGAP